MKFKYILIGVLCTSVFFTSCNKWLDVLPKTETPQDVLFSTEQGFKDAMTGVYIQLKADNIYGLKLTMTVTEQLLSNYDVNSGTVEERLGQFNYADAAVQAEMTSIFKGQYKVISSINAILAKIDEKKAVFKTPGLYELIKGEALALRAYCHFDVLRLWGPVPSEVSAEPILPYVKQMSNLPNQQLSFADFKANVLQDLEDAELLLQGVDPILNYSLVDLGSPGAATSSFKPLDTYFGYRYISMNYYAVKALQARAFLWFEMPIEANLAAKTVINAKNPNGSNKYRLGAASDFGNQNYVLTSEQIFGLHDFNLLEKFNLNFVGGRLVKTQFRVGLLNELFNSEATDTRFTALWGEESFPGSVAKVIVPRKYKVPATAGQGFNDLNRIPMIRLSELYFIAIETATNGAEAQTYWNEFLTSRNIYKASGNVNKNNISNSTAGQIKAILRSEYRKEFYAEGQAFYAYKRWNTSANDFLWLPTNVAINYVVPLPITEFSTAK